MIIKKCGEIYVELSTYISINNLLVLLELKNNKKNHKESTSLLESKVSQSCSELFLTSLKESCSKSSTMMSIKINSNKNKMLWKRLRNKKMKVRKVLRVAGLVKQVKVQTSRSHKKDLSLQSNLSKISTSTLLIMEKDFYFGVSI